MDLKVKLTQILLILPLKQISFVDIKIHSQIASVKALRLIDKNTLCTLISLIKIKKRHHIYI